MIQQLDTGKQNQLELDTPYSENIGNAAATPQSWLFKKPLSFFLAFIWLSLTAQLKR